MSAEGADSDQELEGQLQYAAAYYRAVTEEKLALMELARERGWTYERIGEAIGLQRQAVYQLLGRLRRRRAKPLPQNREA